MIGPGPEPGVRRGPIRLSGVAGIWWATLGLFVLEFAIEPATLSINHIADVLQVTSFLGLIAIGQTLVILAGGIDLSVSGVITLSNIVAARVMQGDPTRIGPAVAVCLVLGLLVGCVNGLLVTKARINPLIATLSMQAVLFGAALIYTGGIPSGGIAPEFGYVGQGRFFGVPVAAILWIVLTLVFMVITRRTTYGRALYAVGANPRAAHLTGVPVDRILVSTYVLSGLMAAAAGLVITAYVGLSSLGIGDPYLLVSIAAVAVGGTALTGGVGGIALSAGGALFMTELGSITNVLQVGSGTQLFIQGAAILIGTAVYSFVQRRRLAPPTRRKPIAASFGM